MSGGCPGEQALEVVLLGGGPPEVAAHAGRCAVCQERLGEMKALGARFQAEVYPATVEGLFARRRRPRRALAVAVAASVAAAGGVAVWVALTPGGDYRGAKGAPRGLAAAVVVAGEARPLVDGERVAPDALLRLQVRAPAGCFLWLASVDARGQVSRLWPAGGEAPALASAAVQAAAQLDGQDGPERFFAVCTAQPWPWEALAEAARPPTSGPEAVRRTAAVARAPAGAFQATLLVEKSR